jgi:hypothetical protein
MRICIGIDAAKATHWAVGIDEGGRVVLDRAVENDAQAIDALVADLRGLDSEVVIGLDVVGSFARFLEAMLLAEGFALVHAPGIAVNRAGQGFAGGERKSDPRDARTIADLVRTRDLRPIGGARRRPPLAMAGEALLNGVPELHLHDRGVQSGIRREGHRLQHRRPHPRHLRRREPGRRQFPRPRLARSDRRPPYLRPRGAVAARCSLAAPADC